MRIILKKSQISILFLYSMIYALLWFGYFELVVLRFGYMGFEWAPNIVKTIEALLVILIFAIGLPSSVKRVSDIFMHIHFLLPIVPMLVLYGAANLSRSYMYLVLIAFTIVCQVRKIRLPKIRLNTIPMRMMMWGLLAATGLYILSIILMDGLRYLNFNFLKVYELRGLSAHNLPRIFGYFSPMISKVLLPIALLIAVDRRKWGIAVLAFSGSLLVFGLTNHKGVIFYPLAVLGIYFMMQARQSIHWLLTGNLFIIFLSLFIFFSYTANILIPSLLIRRVFFIPANMNFIYYDFFFNKSAYLAIRQ